MTTLMSARIIAEHAHRDHWDKSDQPYVGHLERVAAAVAPDEEAQAVAWLHDLVEDRPAWADEMVRQMPVRIVRAVLNLTKAKGEPDELYFARIKADPLTLKVKLADIADNMSEARLGQLDPATQDRLRAKYARARALLNADTTAQGDALRSHIARELIDLMKHVPAERRGTLVAAAAICEQRHDAALASSPAPLGEADGPRVDVLRIAKPDRLDPITAYFEDHGPGRGFVTIRCYGDAWTAGWGAMGDRTVREFVASVDSHYLTSSLLQLSGGSERRRTYTNRVAAAVIAALTPPERPKGQESQP